MTIDIDEAREIERRCWSCLTIREVNADGKCSTCVAATRATKAVDELRWREEQEDIRAEKEAAMWREHHLEQERDR